MTSKKNVVDALFYGFKRITSESVTRLEPFSWAEKELVAGLPETSTLGVLESWVAQEIAFLYEVARGSMVYPRLIQCENLVFNLSECLGG
jgi:hypothetical protein